MPESIAMIGANVWYCGHRGYFIADVISVGNVYVVKANGRVDNTTLVRENVKEEATHHLSDCPHPGWWRPDIGVFVVPKKQVKLLAPGKVRLQEMEEFRKQSSKKA